MVGCFLPCFLPIPFPDLQRACILWNMATGSDFLGIFLSRFAGVFALGGSGFSHVRLSGSRVWGRGADGSRGWWSLAGHLTAKGNVFLEMYFMTAYSRSWMSCSS